MLRVVIDTNVLVSASIAKGASFRIFKEFIIEKQLAQICYSQAILDEYFKVADYSRIQKKYSGYSHSMQSNIIKIQKAGKLYVPEVFFDLITTDVSDNAFLDVAFAAEAQYIITGNHKDFTITNFEGCRIVGPKLFCDLHDQEQL